MQSSPTQSTLTTRKHWLKRIGYTVALLLLVLVGGAWYFKQRYLTAVPVQIGARLDAPAELSQWPWRKARQSTLHRGVTHWLAKQSDGTTLDLFRFDFTANPALRLELFDQDQDDEKPFDNEVKYWKRGVAWRRPRSN